MRKWKIIIAALVILCIMLCMMTIYMEREYRSVQMVNSRNESDLYVLKKDYDKLYAAYYSYDKKILKILEGNKNVFWAKDSSTYVVKNENEFLFSFYKKPKMNGEYLWFSNSLVIDPNHTGRYKCLGAVDTLKPHQFIKGNIEGWETAIVISSKISIKSGDYPGSKIICGIAIR
jgi:hypothetical protein